MGDTPSARRDIKNHVLFEISTEVANRGMSNLVTQNKYLALTHTSHTVGGIYSVLKSKALVTTAEYGERYTLIGPLHRASVSRRDWFVLHPIRARLMYLSPGERGSRAFGSHQSKTEGDHGVDGGAWDQSSVWPLADRRRPKSAPD